MKLMILLSMIPPGVFLWFHYYLNRNAVLDSLKKEGIPQFNIGVYIFSQRCVLLLYCARGNELSWDFQKR
jgi:hypothetical protein